MENKGLLFIPDISGFTQFVTNTEIDHSRLIIQELLEVLIGANSIGLEISEIEGDAVLFYRFGEPPEFDDLCRQVEKMFSDFHRTILAYDQHKYCQCRACRSVVGLTLKIISHYGEFTDYRVRNFHKLIGKDVIVAHQLLKNHIKVHEYWLIKEDLYHHAGSDPQPVWGPWAIDEQQTDVSPVRYAYTFLAPLKEHVQPIPIVQPDLSDKVKVLEVSSDFHNHLIPLFHATGDFNHRHRWMEGVRKVEELQHFLPRVGMKGRYIFEDGESSVYSSSYVFDDSTIQFTEDNVDEGSITKYTLDKLDEGRTHFQLEYYLNDSTARRMTDADKERKRASMISSFQRLRHVADEIEKRLDREWEKIE